MMLIFFFNAPATTEIYTLSLHDALPICHIDLTEATGVLVDICHVHVAVAWVNCNPDRKSTRLNSSHRCISYAVFCLKKKTPSKQLAGLQALQGGRRGASFTGVSRSRACS